MPSSHLILSRPLLLLPPIPPRIRVFSMSQLFAWGDQSTGVSASVSFPPKKSPSAAQNFCNWFCKLGVYIWPQCIPPPVVCVLTELQSQCHTDLFKVLRAACVLSVGYRMLHMLLDRWVLPSRTGTWLHGDQRLLLSQLRILFFFLLPI